MSNPMASITRAATRKPDEPLRILVAPTHERIESCIARTGHLFYAVRTPQVKDWNTRYAPVPENYFLLNPALGEKQIPVEVDFDLVLSQNKFGQFQLLSSLARQLHLPLVSLEHTLPHASWSSAQLSALKAMRGDVNVFISEFSREAWGWSAAEAYVVHHGLDTTVFAPNDLLVERRPQLLSVVNDWKNRDWCMPAGQKILTTRGYIPVEKLKVGMEVLTDDGTPHPVVKTFVRDYFGDMVVVKLDRDTTVRFTPGHAVRVLRDGQWKYVEASRLRSGDTLRFPNHLQTDFSFMGEDEAWLIGLIVGDGSVTDAGNLSISFNETERANAELARDILFRWVGHGAISERHRSRGARAISVDATARVFCSWLKPHIGGKAGEKRLPDFIMRGSIPVRLAALRGLWAADGSFKNGKAASERACYSTISPCLAAQVSELLHSFGVRCSVRRFKRTTNKSSGKVVPIYRVVAYGAENVRACRRVICEADWRNAVRSAYSYVIKEVDLEQEWAGKVYNCEVADDHSYIVAPGFVAHNCCGYRFWQEATQGLPVKVVGDTPGLSLPAASVPELVLRYRESQVFVNTSLVSPVPTALLEAMSCGCAVISTATCMIPEIIRHGENGLLASSPAEMRQHCQDLLADPARCQALGQAARATIVERFSLDRFVKDWDRLLRHAAGQVYTGVS